MRPILPLVALCLAANVVLASPPEILKKIEENQASYAHQAEQMRIHGIEIPRPTVPVFNRFEVRFQLDATYKNPFDPADIDVVAEIVAPNADPIRYPAFFMIPYTPQDGLTRLKGNVTYDPAGDAYWAVRYTPAAPGEYRLRLVANTPANGQSAASDWIAFTATESDHRGFVEISPANPQYFRHSADQSLFFATGTNIAWTRASGNGAPGDRDSVEYYFGKAAGQQPATRVWQCHYAWLEWTPQLNGPLNSNTHYAGLNYYNQMVATAFDRVFELAEPHQLRIMLVLDDNNEHENIDVWHAWPGNPYNQANGGPVAKPNDMYVDAAARAAYRNRIRYVIARWGYSPSLWSINVWNDCREPWPEYLTWLTEMCDHAHAVAAGTRPIIFGTNYIRGAQDISDYAQGQSTSIFPGKPNVIQEVFYTRNRKWFNPTLIHQLWFNTARGMAGVLVWPHPIVDSENAWPIFKSLWDFTNDLPLHQRPWAPLQAKVVEVTASDQPIQRMITVSPYGDIARWGVRATEDRFDLSITEGSQHLSGMAPKLYGQRADRTQWRTEPTFNIDLPPGSAVMVNASHVAGPTSLSVWVDGQPALVHTYPGEGRRELKPADAFVTIPLPQGASSIRLAATGQGSDWIEVRYVAFIVPETDPRNTLVVTGQRSDRDAFLYVYNTTHSEASVEVLDQPPRTFDSARIRIADLPPGTYDIATYDVDAGVYSARTTATADADGLLLQIDKLARDRAIRIRPHD